MLWTQWIPCIRRIVVLRSNERLQLTGEPPSISRGSHDKSSNYAMFWDRDYDSDAKTNRES